MPNVKMPISAEQWRAATGSLDSGKGSFKQKPRTSAKLCPTLDCLPSPPPTHWKGYYTVMVLLSAPLMYRMYVVGIGVMMYLVGPSQKQGTHVRFSRSHHYDTISIGNMVVDASNSESSVLDSVGGGVLCLSLNAVLYVAMVIMVLLIGVRDSRESDKYRWKLIAQRIHHLDSLDLLFWLFSGLECDSIIFDTSIGTLRLHQVHRTPQSSMKTKKTNQSALMGVISPHFILQLSTLVVAMLLLLAGDVERNPGPVTKLDMSDHFEVCRHLKVMNERQLRELGGALGLHFPKVMKMSDLPADMVAAWLLKEDSVQTKSGPPSWESLIKALRRIGHNGVADNIEGEKGGLTSKPGTPEAYDIGHNSLSLRWTEPKDGGDSVIGYITYYKEESSDADWKQQESEFNDMVVGGLLSGKKYLFRIQPKCDEGVGAVSDTSDPVETKSTSPPGKPKVSVGDGNINHDSISICWKAPRAAKNLIGYTIYYRRRDDSTENWKTISCDSNILSHTVKKLQSSTSYIFKVSSTCSTGIGAESECSKPIETKRSCKTGKPKACNISHDSISLEWDSPQYGSVKRYNVQFKQVGTAYWSEKNTTKNSIKLENLRPLCFYDIQVLPCCQESEIGIECSELATIQTEKNSLAERMKAKSHLLSRGESGCLDTYLVPMWTVVEDEKIKIRKCFVGEDTFQSRFRRGKVIMLVGATGTGKTTLINGLVNHVLGVKWEHSYRFKMIFENTQDDQTKSQTKWITSYTIDLQEMEGSPIKYPLTIIDTPGFGDTEGIERDQRLVEQIKAFFYTKGDGGIDQIHAIGFATQAGLARLTPIQKYIFHSVVAVFGNDVKENIFMLTTFADRQPPPVLQAVEAAGVPYHKAFKFNNSALFANNGTIGKMFWEMGKTSFNEFFDELSQTIPKSLTLTKEVLKEREHLEVCVEGLQQRVHAGLSKIATLHQKEQILKLDLNEAFKYPVDVTKQRKVTLPPGKHVTNCLTCNHTCHYPCPILKNEDKHNCAAMGDKRHTPEAECRICPGKCHWSVHVNDAYRIETYQEKESTTPDELKKRYHDTKDGQMKVENMIAKLNQDLDTWYEDVLCNIHHTHQSLKRLEEIALKPNPLTAVGYIELLIESEKKKAEPGYLQRIQLLHILKEKAKQGKLIPEKFNPKSLGFQSGSDLKRSELITKTTTDSISLTEPRFEEVQHDTVSWQSMSKSKEKSKLLGKFQTKKFIPEVNVSSTCSTGVGAALEIQSASSDSEPIETKTILLCKPGQPTAADDDVTHDSIVLNWSEPEHGKVASYTVNYKKVSSDQWMQEFTTKNSFKLENLEHKTSYHIQVYPQIEPEIGIGIESSELITITTKHIPLAERMKEKSRCIERGRSGCLDIYQVPIQTIREDDTKMIRKCFVGEDAVQQTTFRSGKVIMIVGATGTGKTTLINGLVNHVLRVKWEHSYRFKMIFEEPQDDQTKSQTKWITSYTIQEMEESPIKYPLTIIDTPGFGDTEGIERDQRLVEQIRAFFCTKGDGGIDQIHAIGFATQAGLARLTPTQKYIFHSVMAVFGKDVRDIIFMMTTFADAYGQPPPVLQAVKEAGVPYHKAFKFNNSALLANNGETSAINKIFWEMGKKNFTEFFDELSQTTPRSLTLTKEVLKEREHFEVCVEGLLQQVRAGLSKIDTLRQEEDILKKHEAQHHLNKEFIYIIEVTKQKKVTLPPGKHVTNCLTCKHTCHYPCPIPKDEDKHNCTAMGDKRHTPEAECRICPGKCHWSVHVNNPYRFEIYQEKERKTSDDLKKRYHDAKVGKMQVESMIAKLHQELDEWYKEVLVIIRRIQQSLKRLQEIALNPNPLTAVGYIELLIESEKQEAETGYLQRIQSLEKLKEKARLLVHTEKFNPSSSGRREKPWEAFLSSDV